MTVNTDSITSGPYTGNGIVTAFDYTFRVEDKTQLIVYETDLAFNVVELVVDVDYTVNDIGEDAGGTIDRIAGALPTDYTWYIRSDYQPTQATSFESQGAFFPVLHENAFDKNAFIQQQLYDLNSRTFRIADSDPETAAILELPGVELRKNKFMSFNDDGDVVVVASVGTWRGDWLTATAYNRSDMYLDPANSNVYTVITDHTSTTVAADLASGKVELLIDAEAADASATAAAVSAAAALVSENAAAADLVLTNADVVLTHADVVLTGNDVTATNADVVTTNADVLLTGNDVTATNADVVTTNADVVLTGNDVDATNADVISAAASAAAAEVAKIEWQGAYNAGTAYALNDAVSLSGSSFICIQAGTGNTPAVGGTAFWDDLANKGLDGAGAGDLLAANNLSDVVSALTSRSNLGLEIGVDVEAANATILKDADIGVAVAAYDSTLETGATKSPRKNAVINPNFAINQLAVTGTVVLAAGEYGHDGWKGGASGCTYTFATSANVTTITISAGSLQQVIEGVNLLSGTYALSWGGTAQAKIGAGSYSASGVTGAAVGGTNLTIEVNTGTVSKVQLEPGAIASAFEHRRTDEEWSLCLRYFWRFENGIASPRRAAFGQCRSTTLADITIRKPQRMRIAGSISFSSQTGFSLTQATGATAVTTAMVAIDASQEAITVRGTASGLVAGNVSNVLISSGEYIDVNARL